MEFWREKIHWKETGTTRTSSRGTVQRNEAWAKKIATLLQQPGTVFIAVGAAHLAGPDSVQVQLRQMNLPTEQVH